MRFNVGKPTGHHRYRRHVSMQFTPNLMEALRERERLKEEALLNE